MWQEYMRLKPVGEATKLCLDHGDMYLMNGKAAGSDWKKSSISTFRHRAGDDQFLKRNDKAIEQKVSSASLRFLTRVLGKHMILEKMTKFNH